MITKLIETTQNAKHGHNWGKFMVMRPDTEWSYQSALPAASGYPLLRARGWSGREIIVLDIETCEAAAFTPGGSAHADLEKHKVWVCPMFEPFLEWLYRQDLSDITTLPSLVELPDAPFAMSGYRRPGESR